VRIYQEGAGSGEDELDTGGHDGFGLRGGEGHGLFSGWRAVGEKVEGGYNRPVPKKRNQTGFLPGNWHTCGNPGICSVQTSWTP